jgi:uncharacterized protein (TIGR02145 family)
MKKIITICAALIMTASVFAQSPEKMSYQAVVRDGSNNLVTSSAVGMQLSILQGSASGTAVYVETQTPTSNANGLVSVEIGSGTVVSGTFATIDWSNGPYFIKTETDPTGGTSYTITGTSQLLSVPYALHAKTAETVTGGITETDPTFTSSQAANITATDITNLGNLSGVNTGDQDLSTLATKTALGDSTAQVRSEIPDVSGFLTSETDPTFTSSQAANINATDITNLSNLSGVNTGDQDLSTLATKTALGDSTAQVRSEIPDVSGFLTSETDPVFSAWDKSTGISITESQISDLQSYLELPTSGNAGDMVYWNGTAWVTVAATTNEGATLQMIGGVPTWIGGTPPPSNVTNPTTGEIWMDRNLGASQVATSSTDAAAYGDLYQWGRAADGHESRTSGTTSTLATSDTPGHGNFITNGSSPYDWRNPQNDNLWQGVSGTNNPCPSGYRLPTEAEWEAERTSWSSNNEAGAFASPLKLPVAGSRVYSNGTLYNVGSDGSYWSSTVSGTYASSLLFYSSNALMYSYSRAGGFSVRCLKD